MQLRLLFNLSLLIVEEGIEEMKWVYLFVDSHIHNKHEMPSQ